VAAAWGADASDAIEAPPPAVSASAGWAIRAARSLAGDGGDDIDGVGFASNERTAG
jgi:hypothetical protein